MEEQSMTPTLNRRQILAATSTAAGGLLTGSASILSAKQTDGATLPAHYPTQDPDVVREVVGKSHFDLERVRELVDARPELSRAAWDWGFGDWESALGAASHVGRPDIAEYLIEKGARPNLFTFAMLGHLDAVRALIAARPGIQRIPGPHGITLLAHARAGSERAAAVVDFLEELGGADETPTDVPLEDAQRQGLGGVYTFGTGEADRFEVREREGQLWIQRPGGVARALFHLGGHEFHPAGAPSARIRFQGTEGRIIGFEVHNPDLVLRAERP
jgi:hypothetical protein